MAFCAGNSPVTGEFPSQRPVTQSFDVFFDLRLNKLLINNRDSGDLRRHCALYDVTVMIMYVSKLECEKIFVSLWPYFRFPRWLCPGISDLRTFSIWKWWRHQMETFSALLAICAGNSPVSGEFTAQRPVTRSFDVFFDLCLNKRLTKQSWGWWFETLSRPSWHHCNETLFYQYINCHDKDKTASWRFYLYYGIPYTWKDGLTCTGIVMIKIRLSRDRPIFIMEILVFGKTVFILRRGLENITVQCVRCHFWKMNTPRSRYNTVNFLQNNITHNKHPHISPQWPEMTTCNILLYWTTL